MGVTEIFAPGNIAADYSGATPAAGQPDRPRESTYQRQLTDAVRPRPARQEPKRTPAERDDVRPPKDDTADESSSEPPAPVSEPPDAAESQQTSSTDDARPPAESEAAEDRPAEDVAGTDAAAPAALVNVWLAPTVATTAANPSAGGEGGAAVQAADIGAHPVPPNLQLTGAAQDVGTPAEKAVEAPLVPVDRTPLPVGPGIPTNVATGPTSVPTGDSAAPSDTTNSPPVVPATQPTSYAATAIVAPAVNSPAAEQPPPEEPRPGASEGGGRNPGVSDLVAQLDSSRPAGTPSTARSRLSQRAGGLDSLSASLTAVAPPTADTSGGDVEPVLPASEVATEVPVDESGRTTANDAAAEAEAGRAGAHVTPRAVPGDEAAGQVRGGQEARPEPQQFAARIADAVRYAEQGPRELRVRLHPPELGALHIEIASRGGAVTARLDVETAAAHRAILDTIPQLQEALSQQGATVERIEVHLANNHSPDGRSFDSNPDRGQERSRDQTPDERRRRDEPRQETQGPPGTQRPRRRGNVETIDIEV